MDSLSGTSSGACDPRIPAAPSFTSSQEYADLKDVELGQVPGPGRLERIGCWAMIVVAVLMVVGIVMLAVFWNR